VNDLVETFDAMLANEPTLPDITDHVMIAGRRLRRRRRTTVLAAAVVVTGVIAGGVAVPLALRGDGGSTQTVAPPAAEVSVPRFGNAYPAQASAAVCAAGLRPLYLNVPPLVHADANVNGYALRSISPAPGSDVEAGSVVDMTLVVDLNGGGPFGPKPAARLPNVTGLDINKALSVITRLGLTANVTTTTPTGALLVTGQTPRAGTTVPGGSTVTLHVGALGSDGCANGRQLH
jgi:hypothetical protein